MTFIILYTFNISMTFMPFVRSVSAISAYYFIIPNMYIQRYSKPNGGRKVTALLALASTKTLRRGFDNSLRRATDAFHIHPYNYTLQSQHDTSCNQFCHVYFIIKHALHFNQIFWFVSPLRIGNIPLHCIFSTVAYTCGLTFYSIRELNMRHNLRRNRLQRSR